MLLFVYQRNLPQSESQDQAVFWRLFGKSVVVVALCFVAITTAYQEKVMMLPCFTWSITAGAASIKSIAPESNRDHHLFYFVAGNHPELMHFDYSREIIPF